MKPCEVELLCTFDSPSAPSNEDHGCVALSSVAEALSSFLQANFTGGPMRAAGDGDALPTRIDASPMSSVVDALTIDAIEPAANARRLDSLLNAKRLLDEVNEEDAPSVAWWRARANLLHQKVLVHRSMELHDKIFDDFSRFEKSVDFSALDDSLQVFFCAEYIHARLTYKEVSKAEAFVQRLVEKAGIEPRLLGVLGKRTRYQEKAVSQLRVDVKTAKEVVRDEALPSDSLPVNVALTDDTVLDTPNYVENSSIADESLSAYQQVALWALISLRQISSAKDDLLQEVITPYLNYVLQNPKIWGIQREALLARCRWEKHQRRKVERSLAQVESLRNEVDNDHPRASIRVQFGLSIGLSTIWDMEILQADILQSLGCTKEALEVYQRLGDFPNMIQCFKSLGRLDRAEQLIRDQLGVRQTPQLLTYLGDVTNNPKYYEEAWELSGQRFGMAQKNLGMMYLRREMHREALGCYEKAVRTLALADQTWYNMGYCAMQLKDYPTAARAYRRCVDIEPDSFDAWNNLAAAYIHMGDVGKAFYIIQEALKADFDNWKIWDNFLTVSVETGNFSEAIRAIHKLLDLKKTQMDGQLLKVLADRCEADLLPELRQVLARITSVSATSDAWHAYAVALIRQEHAKNRSTTDGCSDVDKIRKALSRTFAMLVQEDPNWEKNPEKTADVLDKAVFVLEHFLSIAESSEDPKKCLAPDFASVRMSINASVSKLRRYFAENLPENFNEHVLKIEGLMSKIRELTM